MIIAGLKGGLGNQLFQYAAARHLSIVQNTTLKLDLTWFDEPEARAGLTPRDFVLRNFNIDAGRASVEEIERMRRHDHAPGVFDRIARRLRDARSGPAVVREKKYFVFDKTVLRAGPNTYLDGYWQNARYFEDSATAVRNDLRVKPKPSALARELLRKIHHAPSVGVHVRRGDYLKAGTEPGSHVTLPATYFIEAARQMAREVSDPHFYVFSDDHAWAREHLSALPRVTFVDHNGPDGAHEDLRLMAACGHQIISNSTFSWWAAWLNENPRKTVFAPSRWFVGDAFDISDLMPGAWRRI